MVNTSALRGDKWFAARCILAGERPDTALSKFEGVVSAEEYADLAGFIRQMHVYYEAVRNAAQGADGMPRDARQARAYRPAVDLWNWLYLEADAPGDASQSYVLRCIKQLLGPDEEERTAA